MQNIMIIDNDPDDLSILQEMLQDADCDGSRRATTIRLSR